MILESPDEIRRQGVTVSTYTGQPDGGARVFWSNDDDCWIAQSLKHAHVSAHGETWQDAVSELCTAVRLADEAAAGEIHAQGVTAHNCRNTTTALDVIRLTSPSWAKWTAMDADGEVWAYEDMPAAAKTMWRTQGGNVRSIGYANVDGIDWTQTLTPVNVTTPTPKAQHDRIAANIVDSIIAVIMAATDTQRADLATALTQRDPHMADALATALDNALYDSQAQQRDTEAASIAADDALMGEVAPLDDDDDDCRCLLAAAQ